MSLSSAIHACVWALNGIFLIEFFKDIKTKGFWCYFGLHDWMKTRSGWRINDEGEPTEHHIRRCWKCKKADQHTITLVYEDNK